MDLATILGLGGGVLLVLISVMLGGNALAFLNLPSLLIVLGGTITVTMISYSIPEMLNTQRLILQTLFTARDDVQQIAREVIAISERARRQGEKDIERLIKTLADKPMLARGFTMILDGIPAADVEQILRQEVTAMVNRHNRSAGILRRAAEVAPAMGLIGTLVGLVQLLGNLQQPDTIGPAMALALLTTLYGTVLSNMVFAPLASKLERNSANEAMVLQVYALGAASISRQENPRRLEMLINSILPPAKRVRYFD
ncbi:MAG TPA: MotA/TolQ/ExbB proton channel family protein [Alphaproteobacteria bacterium]|nr:MotA/TolQ/ExbB proton channel family protein [Alphaproteobacteria bacterium]